MKYPHPVYGWDAVALYRNLTMDQLGELRLAVQRDPASANPKYMTGSIWMYTKAARKKLDAISWAITYHLQDRKKTES